MRIDLKQIFNNILMLVIMLFLAVFLIAIMTIFTPAEARTYRSRAVTSAFQQDNPCPSTGKAKGACPGYIKDHINPLACGGADAPYNIQWQTTEDAKEKDKWERKGCQK